MLAPERSRRAAPARTWTLPDCSVLSLSPLKTVAPTEVCAAPTWAIGVDHSTKRRGRRGPDRRDEERVRKQCCDNSTSERRTVDISGDRKLVKAQARH